MSRPSHSKALTLFIGFLCSQLFFAVALAEDPAERSKGQCSGPLRFYEELKCKPIYEKHRCAVKYDCSHLASRSTDKCYANGNEYAIEESLRDEDRDNPCDVGCTCVKADNEEIARFICAVVDCFPKPINPGCYIVRNITSCCDSKEKCPKNPNDRPKCIIDGKTYLEGEVFFPKNTNLLCQCREGYTGQRYPPYCRKISCGLDIRNPSDIRDNCAPIYASGQSPISSCPSGFRCPNTNDSIIHPNNENPHGHNRNICKFGKLKLHIGDKLNQITDYLDECIDCTCEVPPAITCRRLQDRNCKKKNL